MMMTLLLWSIASTTLWAMVFEAIESLSNKWKVNLSSLSKSSFLPILWNPIVIVIKTSRIQRKSSLL